MQAVDFVHFRVFKRALLDHAASAGPALLARLKEQHDVLRKLLPVTGEQLRKQQQDGHVAVMAAGVHLPGVLRAPALVRVLLARERVHVGAEGDRALRLLGVEHGLRARGRDLAQIVRPAGGQLLQHIGLRPV